MHVTFTLLVNFFLAPDLWLKLDPTEVYKLKGKSKHSMP